jgi:hypothetical protein
MLAVAGTVPLAHLPVLEGVADLEDGRLRVDGVDLDLDRGTPALLASACAAARVLGRECPHAFLVGDTGPGHGSRLLYAHLVRRLPATPASVLVFHYFLPDVDWHAKVLFAAQSLQPLPRLVADAGFMYAAKMSGQAAEYDLFTPDAGELAFLADERAPHPFYARGFLLAEEARAPELIARAAATGGAARHMLVKGGVDRVARGGEVLHEIDGPVVEALEAMGGTGDTLTGLACALLDSGRDVPEACLLAARANRLAGMLARPTPASHIGEIVARIPEALAQVLASA